MEGVFFFSFFDTKFMVSNGIPCLLVVDDVVMFTMWLCVVQFI